MGIPLLAEWTSCQRFPSSSHTLYLSPTPTHAPGAVQVVRSAGQDVLLRQVARKPDLLFPPRPGEPRGGGGAGVPGGSFLWREEEEKEEVGERVSG
jgi:hypothetical protein